MSATPHRSVYVDTVQGVLDCVRSKTVLRWLHRFTGVALVLPTLGVGDGRGEQTGAMEV